MNRYWIITILLSPLMLFAAPPEWLSQRPISSQEIYGIGQVEITTPDYAKVAEKAALAEIARQLSVTVEAESFIRVATNEDTQFKQDVTLQSAHYLEGQKLVGTYQENGFYFVCYKLDKAVYEVKKRQKAREVASQGLECLEKAEQALGKGQLAHAVSFYIQGLQIVEPWLFLNLEQNGRNVPVALFEGYLSAFEGISIFVSPSQADLANYSAIDFPITTTIQRNNTPLPNIPLLAEFVEGNGQVTKKAQSDINGKAVFHLTQIAGKEGTQQIRILVDEGINGNLPASYRRILSKQVWPEAMFTIHVKSQEIVAYLRITEDEIPNSAQQIESLLSNEHFQMTTNENAASHIVEMATKIRYQGVIKGEIEDMDEYMASLSLRLLNKETGEVLMTYMAEGIRVLTKENSTVSQVANLCNKELMKRVKRELPMKLKKVTLY